MPDPFRRQPPVDVSDIIQASLSKFIGTKSYSDGVLKIDVQDLNFGLGAGGAFRFKVEYYTEQIGI